MMVNAEKSSEAVTQGVLSLPETVAISLLFFSVGGVSYGVDSGQVEHISAYKGEQDDDLHWFHKEFGYGDNEVSYQSPTVASIKTDLVSPYRVIIDSIEDITEFSQNDISLFPPLMAALAFKNGLWWILSRRGKMVFLLDFRLMLREKQSNQLI